MIQMQTDLIAAMWQQSNATLHEEYIDKLNYSVSHFLVQLRSMELGIRDSLESKESQILRQLAEATRIGAPGAERDAAALQRTAHTTGNPTGRRTGEKPTSHECYRVTR